MCRRAPLRGRDRRSAEAVELLVAAACCFPLAPPTRGELRWPPFRLLCVGSQTRRRYIVQERSKMSPRDSPRKWTQFALGAAFRRTEPLRGPVPSAPEVRRLRSGVIPENSTYPTGPNAVLARRSSRPFLSLDFYPYKTAHGAHRFKTNWPLRCE